MRLAICLAFFALIATGLAGCSPSTGSGSGSGPQTNGKYTILDTRTDNFDFGAAKALAEDSIVKHPDLGCMVGLFAYNPPYILEALKTADKVDQIKLVGFDEEDGTLQAITDGQCHGTVVQDPYRYGYESVRILAGLARGDMSVVPEDGFFDIPAQKITKDNVKQFWDRLKELTAEDPDAKPTAKDDSKPTVAFVTNGIASFWVIAEKGARDAAKKFDVNLLVRMPPADDGVGNQKRMLEELLTLDVDGIAVSPIDPDNQTDVLDLCAKRTKLITHDSDAPKSNRICYVGMDNYDAGRKCGELVLEAIPDGGKIMIFVGRLEQLNAKLRNQGVIDEVLDRPRAISITGQPMDPVPYKSGEAKDGPEADTPAKPDEGAGTGPEGDSDGDDNGKEAPSESKEPNAKSESAEGEPSKSKGEE